MADLRDERSRIVSVREVLRLEFAKAQEERVTHETLAPTELDAIPEWGTARRKIEDRIEDLAMARSQFRVREKLLGTEIDDAARKIVNENQWLIESKTKRERDKQLNVGYDGRVLMGKAKIVLD